MALFGVWWVANVLNVLVILLGVMLIGLVLLQEGKGGGLTGALGGMSGSTPLGYRSADALVKVTIGFAGVWVLLIILQVWAIQSDAKSGGADAGPVVSSPLDAQ
ncbi:preprotein translocase subunit SecG [Tuwongella immobilis]|uniref:Protein-export membrane protein SecG n=1 Tax=Tuwongella immobilis TaxID=692036 RepID=A0A6C2YS47_9BACT|nr:preprotein translocase subunit SecG [Tuwongella immobilis]VIP04181.1 preprotein translocase subunit : : SecG [Tuwongella immobilis]VTS05726.1 preprotein translocase subunit : : SecG [Tuwongella immobilis]